MKKLALYCSLSLAVICIIAPADALSQTSASAKPVDDSQTLRVLLDEVRQLRLALQRLNISSRRLQMLGERIRLQQGRVDSLRRELGSIRSQLAKAQTSRAEVAEQIKRMEEHLSSAPNTEERTALKHSKSPNTS